MNSRKNTNTATKFIFDNFNAMDSIKDIEHFINEVVHNTLIHKRLHSKYPLSILSEDDLDSRLFPKSIMRIARKHQQIITHSFQDTKCTYKHHSTHQIFLSIIEKIFFTDAIIRKAPIRVAEKESKKKIELIRHLLAKSISKELITMDFIGEDQLLYSSALLSILSKCPSYLDTRNELKLSADVAIKTKKGHTSNILKRENTIHLIDDIRISNVNALQLMGATQQKNMERDILDILQSNKTIMASDPRAVHVELEMPDKNLSCFMVSYHDTSMTPLDYYPFKVVIKDR
ncbi:hypothetical protein [Marinomonas mediterranea]|uniref:Uncharacterized protein n=1 Tax=Marinomonas mediterranea (strain ATCC 700492 / JCM 21426 / NBRC 103028 / MMB-1) TaxID=717774 RepID=F2JW06_MARM1|nr:hypothetical protein [Marinomonas mediterranea]ADZ92894.1 hypothetical protein Marme_3683 [Marinomonas mediterranea MMB-1]WCN18915.1 hypothetical protein GV053_18650 [Marinomonas mediterranea MMB-1]